MKDLLDYQHTTEALEAVSQRTGWDQETMMPRGAAQQRGEEMAALEEVLHARRTAPQLGEWLANAQPATPAEEAMLRIMRRDYARHTKVPADLAKRIAQVSSLAQGKWAEARAAEDVPAFLPVLAEVLDLRRQEGAAIADGGDPYDALLQDYEPGSTSAEIAEIFDALRPRLVALRDKVLAQPAAPQLQGHFDADQQMALAQEMAIAFGYDMDRGRIDKAVHPFCSGNGLDVRLTTRTDEADPFNCLYSTIHETGHGCYELNIAAEYRFTPLGRGVSMGVHESQSRIYENQLARSADFAEYLHGRMEARFGDMGLGGAQEFARAVNRVSDGFIRTEADELSYNLHVMMRFDLERALIRGDMEVGDLEAAWNDRFARDFGVQVPRPSLGMLQDVHWSVGLMGYFPTYSLGNVYAGCLYEALCRDVTDLDADLRQGNPGRATAWLAEHVQRHGAQYEPRDLIARASGAAPGPEPLLTYLEQKFGALYAL